MPDIIRKSVLSTESVMKISEKYNATFICDTSIKGTDGNYINKPVSVFYSKEKGWMGVIVENGKFFIIDASSVENQKIVGLQYNNEIIFSSYRHDYVCFPKNPNICIDGGRDYTKINDGTGEAIIVLLQVTKDGLKIVDNC